MMVWHLKNHRGLTLLEVIVTIAITSIVMGAIVTFMNRAIHFKATADTIQRFRRIGNAFEVLYRENIRYVEDTCYGWGDASCQTLAILPVADESSASNRTIVITTTSDTALDAFREAGCTLIPGTLPVYRVTCADGFGFDYTFSISREHTAGTIYKNGYIREPYKVTITAGGNESMEDTWSSGYLDSEYMVRSREKLFTVARAMKSYHLSRLTVEAISNPCGGQGGLASNDDILIPWIWQAAGSDPVAKCTGATSGNCGCSRFDKNIWSTDGAMNTINTDIAIINFLAGINIGNEYRTDGFGNPIAVRLITLSDGMPVAFTPPAPSPKWSWTGAFPPYGGTVGIMNDGAWIYSKRVIYPQ